jgi:hypothetical protein
MTTGRLTRCFLPLSRQVLVAERLEERREDLMDVVAEANSEVKT